VAAVVLSLGGCRDREPAPATETEGITRGDAGETAPAASPKAVVDIELLDRGAEPRQALRYRLAEGTSERVALTMSYRAENRIQAAPSRELQFPVMKMVFRIDVAEDLGDGKLRYHFELEDTSLGAAEGADRALVAMAGSALKRAEGLRGSAVVDSRGVIGDGKLELPPGLDPGMRVMMESMRSSMEQLSSPMPEEPVGLGARWELRQVLVQAGTSLEQVTTYELAAVPGDDSGRRHRLRGDIRQSATRQEVSLPGVDRAELVALTAAGSSEIDIDLDRLSPGRGAIAIESESRFEVTVGEVTRSLVSKGELDLEITAP
jgi:hypothetical protein